ncbi:MAG: FAD-dependent oxidoreductase [Myxococcota bacterium]
MRVAIIGSGVSGLVCAHRLHPRHDVQIFERDDWIGGHTHTVDVAHEGTNHAIDTGFIVYNERNYPHFSALLRELDVETQPTRMTFGFRSARTGLEYSGSSLRGLFAQRRNVFRPRFWSMLSEILRFFREARALLEAPRTSLSLGEFLDAHGFGQDFQQEHLLPMGAAIWSCPPDQMRAFPAESFARFFQNHGLLSLRDRPQWRVVSGGSARYVEALTRPFRDRIRLGVAVERVVRDFDGIEFSLSDGSVRSFDAVVLACHSDQALALLSDASPLEKEVLGAIRYQPNDVVLHTDASLLPRRAEARSAWNYHVPDDPGEAATVTYDMNRLQGIDASVDFLVTLNSSEEIDPERVIAQYTYAHPIFDAAAMAVQRHQDGLGAERRSAFCGAYWGYGFHEDGVRSGLVAAEQIERLRP